MLVETWRYESALTITFEDPEAQPRRAEIGAAERGPKNLVANSQLLQRFAQAHRIGARSARGRHSPCRRPVRHALRVRLFHRAQLDVLIECRRRAGH